MTEAEIEALEAKLKAATPGPWEAHVAGTEGWIGTDGGGPPTGYDGEYLNPADALLIAALANAAPALLKLAMERVTLPVVKSCGECAHHDATAVCFHAPIRHLCGHDNAPPSNAIEGEHGAPPAWCPLRRLSP